MANSILTRENIKKHRLRHQQMIQISAVICTFNRAGYLKKAIQSLINQTLPDKQYEIIVVDNHSTDNTKEIVQNFRKFNNLKYIYEPVKGLSQARNTGWQNAHGKYVAYLDDDAIACSEWLERIVRVFETISPQPGSVGGKITLIWENERPEWMSKNMETCLGFFNLSNKPKFLKDDREGLRGGNVTYPRELLRRFGGFSTKLGRKGNNLLSNDEIYLNRCLEKNKLLGYYDPDICVQHHVPVERLVENWFYNRYFWQGVSSVVLSHIEKPKKRIYYLLIGFINACYFVLNPRNLLALIDNSRVYAMCKVKERLGRIWMLFRLGLGKENV